MWNALKTLTGIWTNEYLQSTENTFPPATSPEISYHFKMKAQPSAISGWLLLCLRNSFNSYFYFFFTAWQKEEERVWQWQIKRWIKGIDNSGNNTEQMYRTWDVGKTRRYKRANKPGAHWKRWKMISINRKNIWKWTTNQFFLPTHQISTQEPCSVGMKCTLSTNTNLHSSASLLNDQSS